MLNDARDWYNSGYIGDIPHSKTGASALHVAAAKGYVKVMNLLIQAGMEVNIQVLRLRFRFTNRIYHASWALHLEFIQTNRALRGFDFVLRNLVFY